ncbi:hypothetical protein QE152_g22331 [Popillia japonica]|uniref:Uncharacterized protein n=1 Tax=Popillia japonica TaxID=7064 RepID=A0AAW1KLD2_POPJA
MANRKTTSKLLQVGTASESSSQSDDGEFDSDADYEPSAPSSSDSEQYNLLSEKIDEITPANTIGSDDESNNGDATENIDNNPLELMDDNNT